MSVSFTRSTLRHCYDRAEGRCECQRRGHNHAGRCNRELFWWGYGRLAPAGWLAVARTPLEMGGRDDADNAEAVCWECYEQGVQTEAVA